MGTCDLFSFIQANELYFGPYMMLLINDGCMFATRLISPPMMDPPP